MQASMSRTEGFGEQEPNREGTDEIQRGVLVKKRIVVNILV